MPNDKTPTCPHCGNTHDDWPFSKGLIALWRKVEAAPDEESRFEYMLKMAEHFVSDISDTDEDMNEEFHALMANVVESRLAFEKHSLILARALLRSLPHHVHDHEAEEPATEASKTERKLN